MWRIVSVCGLAAVVGCGGGHGGSQAGGSGGSAPQGGRAGMAPQVAGPAVPVQGLTIEAPERPAFDALAQRVAETHAITAATLATAYPAPTTALPYDPLKSDGLALINASDLKLTEAELSVLKAKGLVLSDRQRFATFASAYATIYHQHLPVYVSADSIMDAVHSGYDDILQMTEVSALVPLLKQMLQGMRSKLPALAATDARADADLYLAVALSLLLDEVQMPVAGADAARVRALFSSAQQATGLENIQLFDTKREEDFSQFKPRGHYENDPVLKSYFRCMMWLGRVDLRLIETLSDGSQVFRPRQFAAALLFYELLQPEGLAVWKNVDDVVRLFVGESDNMVVPELGKLVTELGGLPAARAADGATVAHAIIKGGYGAQQIASYFAVNDETVPTLPLNRSFALFGQRYVADSHVLANVVYDRLPQKRMMPSGLDVAFAGLQNNAVLSAIPDITAFSALPPALAKMRTLLDSYDDTYWSKNLYNLWWKALRELSPTAPQMGLPSVAKTAGWGLRIANAQLGSWARLRHDTILYAKQSYTGAPGCEYPDAYVEPYPEFFGNLGRFASAAVAIADVFKAAHAEAQATAVTTYFQNLSNAMAMLQQMALAQRQGIPFSAAQMAFINNAVRIESKPEGCVTIDVPDGWYPKLFFSTNTSIKIDLTVADVHTQPADEGGGIVGKVLHAGVAYPRLMAITIDTCNGPRAYVGPAYSFHEEITKDFSRLTDSEWTTRVNAAPPASPAWLAPISVASPGAKPPVGRTP